MCKEIILFFGKKRKGELCISPLEYLVPCPLYLPHSEGTTTPHSRMRALLMTAGIRSQVFIAGIWRICARMILEDHKGHVTLAWAVGERAGAVLTAEYCRTQPELLSNLVRDT